MEEEYRRGERQHALPRLREHWPLEGGQKLPTLPSQKGRQVLFGKLGIPINWDYPEITYKAIIDYCHNLGFYLTSGKKSIHSPESIKFAACVLKTDTWYNATVQNGLNFEFEKLPAEYEEVNNRSAVKHGKFLDEKIQSWKESGFIKLQNFKPYCCSPLSVAEKLDYDKGLKLRPVLDLSRHVNKCFKTIKCKLDDLSVSEKHLTKNCYQAVFDLENQFFHVKIKKEQQTYFGFSIKRNEQIYYYVFQVFHSKLNQL